MAARNRRNIKKAKSKPVISFVGFWRGLKKCILIVSILGLLGITGFYTTVKVNDFLNRPIEQLVIQGDFTYTDAVAIERLIQRSANQSFVKEHLANIRKTVEASPWVDNASLTRQWPNTLIVKVTEQQPIARWGDQGFVNFRGELVKTQSVESIQYLPLLFGEELEAAKVMQQYKTLAPLFLSNNLVINSLSKNNLGVWELQLNNGWQLILGRNSLAEKVKLVSHVLSKEILLVGDAIKTIDMRYENGFAIAWDESIKTILDDQNETNTKVGEPS